jgi:two-component system response regulator AlgR
MKILIVDDEPLARERLRDLVERSGAHVVLQAGNGIEALEVAGARHPDTVLLDIRMPGMDGLETASHLAKLEPAPALIFTTAYDEHALQAFEANAVDYLLKPVRAERLEQALERAVVLGHARLAALRAADHGSRARTHISLSARGRIELVPVADIVYLRADQKYVTVGWRGREGLLDESLKVLEEEFAGRFLRIHRNTLVASGRIEALERIADGSYVIRLRDVSGTFPVSRRHLAGARRAFREWIGGAR